MRDDQPESALIVGAIDFRELNHQFSSTSLVACAASAASSIGTASTFRILGLNAVMRGVSTSSAQLVQCGAFGKIASRATGICFPHFLHRFIVSPLQSRPVKLATIFPRWHGLNVFVRPLLHGQYTPAVAAQPIDFGRPFKSAAANADDGPFGT